MDADEKPPSPEEVLYLDYVGHPYPLFSRIPGLGAVVNRLTADSIQRRHPREADYMLALIRQAHGDEYVARVQPITHADQVDSRALRRLRAVVLLWRDGNGTGWFPIERRVFSGISGDARLLVLNGRRRQFELTRRAWSSYLMRRALGKSLIAEAMFTVWFVVATPFLFTWDLLRGHR